MDKASEQTFFKIYDNVNQTFVEAGMKKSRHGKTWSRLNHAKTAIAVHTKNREGRYTILRYKAMPEVVS